MIRIIEGRSQLFLDSVKSLTIFIPTDCLLNIDKISMDLPTFCFRF